MADFAYSQAEMDAAEEIDPGRWQWLINGLGGVVSLILIAGMITWGWQMMVRDVSGVPVVEALEGPMRIEPADPGGVATEHQGLAVNRIAEGQEAAPAADRIVLAPPPVELGELPQVTESATAPAIDDEAAAPLADEATETDIAALAEAPAAAPTPEAASEATLALIDRLMEEENAAAATPEPAGFEVIPISVSGVRQSLFPVQRPASLELASVQQTAAAGPAAGPTEIDPDGLATGTRLVQLGAYDDAETARAEWDRLAAAFPEFFDPRQRIVQEAVSGGRSFYRLRAHGFDDLMDARRFCTALLADGAACIPVTVR